MPDSARWDEIINFYMDVLEKAKPSTISWHLVACSKNMLSLIAQIRNDLDFEPFELSLSHVTLQFSIPGDTLKIGVWGEEVGRYGLYHERPGSVYSDEIMVDATDVIPKLKEYLEPLRPVPSETLPQEEVEPTEEDMIAKYSKVKPARLVREMAHDVRTPLTAIVGYGQLLSMAFSIEGKFSMEDKMHYINMILDSATKINMFLDATITVNDDYWERLEGEDERQ
jgi:signal transduction histidine kinase